MIGASGSIAAVMGAYMVLYPDAKVNTFFCLPFGIGFEKVSAKNFIGLYIAFDVFFAVFGTNDGVAYCAHIGGFVFWLLRHGKCNKISFRPRELFAFA